MRRGLRISTIALVAALFVTMPASAQILNLGGSNSSTDSSAGATVNLNDLLGNSDSSTNDATASIGSGDSGSGSVTLNLDDALGSSDADSDATLDLFGTETATADLGLNGSDGSGSISVLDGSNDVTLDLFGDGSGTGGGGGTGGNGGTGGSGGTGIFGSSSGVQVASLGNNSNSRCITPNANQIETLVNRHRYSSSTFSSWAGASQLTIVKVNVCASAQDRLSASLAENSNVSRLQDYLAGNARIRNGLESQGYSTNDVLATDRDGNRLIVYVM